MRTILFVLAVAGMFFAWDRDLAQACTRVVYLGPEGRILTARSMDWKQVMDGNMWILPRGVERDGRAGPRSVKWVSKYGSVVMTGFDIATADGFNEAGLMANALWLTTSRYPDDDGVTPRMSLAIWAQYFLDLFATVEEAIAHIRANPFHVVTGEVPGQPGRLAAMHLSLSDASGDSAILEWIDGELRIHHGREYQVMTNEPRYEDQLAILRYWSRLDGTMFLPGSGRAEDRFVRAHFLINAVEQHSDARRALAAALSVIRNVSAPYGISIENQPNLSTTRWRVVADHKDRLYYFESVEAPNLFWVDLKKVDFSPEAGVRMLDLGPRQQNIFSGDVSGQFVPAEPFIFLEAG